MSVLNPFYESDRWCGLLTTGCVRRSADVSVKTFLRVGSFVCPVHAGLCERSGLATGGDRHCNDTASYMSLRLQ